MKWMRRKPRVSEAVDSYLSYKYRNLSKNSIRAYKNVLSRLSERHGKIPVQKLTRDCLNTVINTEGAHKSRELRKAVIDDFQNWLLREEFISFLIPTEVYATRIGRQNGQILTITENQLAGLVDQARDLRLKTILQVAFYMGLRISEIIHCRPAWIIDGGRFLRIGDLRIWRLEDEFHPKSQKEHDPPIAVPHPVKQVFQNRQSNNRYERLFEYRSDSTLRSALKVCFATLPDPLRRTFTPHHLRHSCISYWLNEKRVPIQEVQRLARHSRIETTMKYYHPDDQAHWKAFNG